MSDLFSPPGGWRVRIKDLSGAAEDGTVEEIGGFSTLMQANEFARRYVRDSLERCRDPGLSAQEVVRSWSTFGEDAEVLESGDGGWRSESHIVDFAAEHATREERDWRVLDPRTHQNDQEQSDGDDDTADTLDEDEL